MATDEFRFAYTPYVSLADRHFNKLGTPLPQGVAWDDILKAVPTEQYKQSNSKAAIQLGTALATLSFGLWLISVLPWILLPIGWTVCGIAATSLYAVWRDASNNVWSSSSAANSIVATLTSLVLLPNALPMSGLKSTSKTDAARRQSARVIELFGSGVIAAYLGIGWDFKTVLRYLLVPIVVSRAALRLISKLHRISPVSRLPAANSNRLTTVFAVPSSLRPLDIITNFIRLPADCFTRRTSPATVMPTYNAPAALAALLNQFPAHFHECRVGWRLLADLFTFNRSPDAIVMENSANMPKKSQSSKNQSKAAPSAASAPSPSPIAALIGFAKRLNLIHCYILLGTPALALYGAYSDYNYGSGIEWAVRRRTLVWAVIYYFCTGLGITAGYHRLWSHKAYSVHWTVELLLSFFSSGAVEGSAIWWCRGHRAHHRYTDTDNDPYSAKKGFFYAHMGWMLMKPDRKYGCDVTDLKNNWILSLQHRTYAFQSLFFGYAFPAMVAGALWGDWFGGLWIAGALRLCFVHHSTFCVNSVAHYLGDQTFDDERTPRDSIVTALVTLGEGYHNFHHEFPSDYRNGIRFYDYDPTKWLISTLSVLGLAWDLNTFPDNEIRKGKLNMTEKKLEEERTNIAWPKDVSSLPIWTEAQWKAAQEEAVSSSEESRRLLVVVDGLVHELGAFAHAHPGGEAMLRAYANKDASSEFHGAVYRHSHAARNLLSNYRIARLESAQ